MTTIAAPDSIAAFVEDPATTLLLFDIDGVLAEITLDPAETVVPDETRQMLSAAHARFAGVGFVTGRDLDMALQLLATDTMPVAASHGMHVRFPDGTTWIDPVATAARPQLELAVQMAKTVGWRYEDKLYSVALHFRHIADPAATEQQMRSQISTVLDPRTTEITGARQCVEIRPKGAATKGDAVLRLVEHAGDVERIVYMGDDLTDIDAFDALADTGAQTLAVAVASDESPEGLLQHADIVIDGVGAVREALRVLVG